MDVSRTTGGSTGRWRDGRRPCCGSSPARALGPLHHRVASVVAWPFLRGYGRTPSVPSLLDRPYGTGFLALIAVVGTIALAWTALSFVRNARNLAARVAAQAQGGQTLATSAIADVARAQAVPIVELGCFSLRNIAQPVELFELELVPPTEAVSIDPVCRMQVRHGSAAGRLRHLDRDHWFCSFECVQAFTAAPEQY